MKIISKTVEAMTLPYTISLVVSDTEQAEKIIVQLVQKLKVRLDQIEEKFSVFRKESLVSQFRAGNLSVILDREFQEVYTRTIAAQKESGGYFNPYFDGGFNPTGFVKGWAIGKLFKELLLPLFKHPFIEGVCLNGGGDMQFDTRFGSSFVWDIGIENPYDLKQLLAHYRLTKGAVATSGFAKRGQHIKQNQSRIEQVTVVGEDISKVDVWATALLACPESEVTSLISTHRLSGLYIKQNYHYYYQNGEFYEKNKSSV